MLTDMAIRQAKAGTKLRNLSNAHGLQLSVVRSGYKYWCYAYRHFKMQKVVAFGSYPQVNLNEARKFCVIARDQIRNGLDPSHEK